MSVVIKLSLFLQFLPPGLLFVTSLRVSLEDQLIKIAEFIDTKQGRVSSGAREIPPRSSTSAARSKNATLNSTREPRTAFPLRSSPWGSVEADTWRNPVSCTSFFEAVASPRGGFEVRRPCDRRGESAAVFLSRSKETEEERGGGGEEKRKLRKGKGRRAVAIDRVRKPRAVPSRSWRRIPRRFEKQD